MTREISKIGIIAFLSICQLPIYMGESFMQRMELKKSESGPNGSSLVARAILSTKF